MLGWERKDGTLQAKGGLFPWPDETQVDLSGQVFKHLGQPAKPPQEEGADQDT